MGNREEKTPKRKRTARPRRQSRLTREQKILVVIAGVLAVILAVVIVVQSLFVKPEVGKKPFGSNDGDGTTEETYIDYGDGVRPKADGERKSENFYTVLILGRDTGGGGQTDTMLLASYDVTNQKATVMSIPRDTMVNVDWDVKKINSVYSMYGGGDKGIKALYKEIAQLVGFEPDYQVVVEWDAVGKIVDAMGGVYFDVPYNMDYHDPYQDLVIEQEKGYRLLNGDDAMQVIRWRQNDKNSPYGNIKIGDSGRMQMQQDFLKAVIKQMMQPKVVLKLGEISKVFEESVETDLSFQNILWFGKSAFQGGLSLENVEFCTMPYTPADVWSRSYNQNLAYLLPQSKALLELVNTKLSPFVEESKLSDLDIMYVNDDGSIGSTSGYVEDSIAAQPPRKPETEEDKPAYTVDEYGNVVDPETGEVIYYVDVQGNLIDPNTGEIVGNMGGSAEEEPEGGGTTAPETGEVTDPETGEGTVLPETGETTEQPEDNGGAGEISGGQELDPVTEETVSQPETGSEPMEPAVPEEPVPAE